MSKFFNSPTVGIDISADLRVTFHGYNTIFSDTTSNSSIAILSTYPTPQSILDAPKEKIIDILLTKSRKGLDWSEKIYSKLISVANEASIIELFIRVYNITKGCQKNYITCY